MAIDIPHIWLYLAELVNPVLRERGISMRELFRYLGFVSLDLGKHNGVWSYYYVHICCMGS